MRITVRRDEARTLPHSERARPRGGPVPIASAVSASPRRAGRFVTRRQTLPADALRHAGGAGKCMVGGAVRPAGGDAQACGRSFESVRAEQPDRRRESAAADATRVPRHSPDRDRQRGMAAIDRSARCSRGGRFGAARRPDRAGLRVRLRRAQPDARSGAPRVTDRACGLRSAARCCPCAADAACRSSGCAPRPCGRRRGTSECRPARRSGRCA